MAEKDKVAEIKETLEKISQELGEIKEILADIAFILAVDSTENIQVTENTSKIVNKEVPPSCRTSHFRLREHIVQIASKWNKDRVLDLKKHLFGHE